VTGKEVILQVRDRAMADRAIQRGFTKFLVDRPLPGLAKAEEYRLTGSDIRLDGRLVGEYVVVRRPRDVERIQALRGKRAFVVVETTDWKVIPLENLLAALDSSLKLFAVARNPKEAELFLTTLERGVDGVIIRPRDATELEAFEAVVNARPSATVELVAATVTRIVPVGMGERACIDTASLFAPGEGMLVGSSSAGFFLVMAECLDSPFAAARPFRVNAGAIHSYLLSGSTTRYLSEVRAGERVEAVAADGRRRDVVVGRSKIETRPLVLVEAQTNGHRHTILLQNAETVRLIGPGGRSHSVGQLRKGHRVLVHTEEGARHFGMKVQERISEQ
jgi:3-dehydroquinate synthase II